MRLRLVQDDSSHWYAIPADKREEFETWAHIWSGYEGEDFEQYRLNMYISNYTFTDLLESK